MLQEAMRLRQELVGSQVGSCSSLLSCAQALKAMRACSPAARVVSAAAGAGSRGSLAGVVVYNHHRHPAKAK